MPGTHVSAELLQQAWQELRAHMPGVSSLELALQDPCRSSLLHARAAQLQRCPHDKPAPPRKAPKPRLALPRLAELPLFDRKRAAAGDFDE